MYHCALNTSNWKPAGRDAPCYDNILEAVGKTPLVKLNRIPKEHGLECEFYAKCEYVNPGGSIKDRIAYTMVVDAENSGKAHEGTRFVEPTSGNTGVGLVLTAAVKGYKTTIVTTDKNSNEKMNTMKLLGADLVVTSAAAKAGDPDHFMEIAKRIVAEDPAHNICLNQFSNPVNPLTHMNHTGREILDALGHVDMAVMGAGTGGTLTGLARRLKRACRNCIIVAADPKGSLIWGKQAGQLYASRVEGIGDDFLPEVLDKSCVDTVVTTNDKDSFNMAREVIIKEGLLCGGSSGAAMWAALKAAKEHNLGAGKKVVVVFPDGIRNYMNKFVCDQWMEAHLFKEPPAHKNIEWWNHLFYGIRIDTSVPHIPYNALCKDAIAAMGSEHSVAIITGYNGIYKGAISKNQLRNAATNPKKNKNLDLNEPVHKHLIHDCLKLIEDTNPTVGLVSRMMDIAPFVVVVAKQDHDKTEDIFIPKGIITSEMVWQYILKHIDNNKDCDC